MVRNACYAALLAIAATASPALAADWLTARGNPQRTGSVDQKPAPRSPKVLWVYDSQEHFIAAPVPAGQTLFISGLGAFTTASFHALSLADNPPQREIWSKRPPYLKLPVVCAPAVSGKNLVFGDGMHQTSGATLYCMTADAGRPLWQYPVPGALVHLEGAPTIADNRIYIGGGAAGVLCIDMSQLTLNGQSVDPAAAQAAIEKQWKELTAKYEAEKLKDPDFAVPPSEDALPKPSPKLLWQAGANQWHVDAPLAVAGDRVLIPSAKLGPEDNNAGVCALFCADARSGQVQWQAPLEMNPWSGPTVVGNTVLAGCSSIRFDPKAIPTAKGQIVALSLADGKPLWKKPLPGGVIAPVAATPDLALVPATDGKLRALSLKDGQEKWTYDAKAPLFAGAAVSNDVAIVADLKAVVHAVNLADGTPLWRIDLAADPAVKAPGMVFGSPVLHEGRLYVVTTNHESGPDQQRTVVVCIGDK